MGTIPEGYCLCGCGDTTIISRYGRRRKYRHGHNSRKPAETRPGPNRNNGMCECGCGNAAPIAKRNTRARGHIRGKPVRFPPRHVTRKSQVDYVEEDRDYKTPCWVWQRGTSAGYGYMTRTQAASGKKKLAHRVYYERARGPIPHGLTLDHLCVPHGGTTLCVNPDHLEPVTQAENSRRGRRAILTARDAAEIRQLYVPYKVTAPMLAERFGVAVKTIYGITGGYAWAD